MPVLFSLRAENGEEIPSDPLYTRKAAVHAAKRMLTRGTNRESIINVVDADGKVVVSVTRE